MPAENFVAVFACADHCDADQEQRIPHHQPRCLNPSRCVLSFSRNFAMDILRHFTSKCRRQISSQCSPVGTIVSQIRSSASLIISPDASIHPVAFFLSRATSRWIFFVISRVSASGKFRRSVRPVLLHCVVTRRLLLAESQCCLHTWFFNFPF